MKAQMNQKKLDNSIVNKLFSLSEKQINEAVESISKDGNSDYIPSLVETLRTSQSTEIQQNIIRLLSEIKHKDAVPHLAKAIGDEKNKTIREVLIRSCWENGLDFSNYLYLFIDVLISGEYMEAFEAYTLLENTEGKISETSAREYIDQLKNSLNEVPEDRKTLIHAVIQYLPSLIKE